MTNGARLVAIIMENFFDIIREPERHPNCRCKKFILKASEPRSIIWLLYFPALIKKKEAAILQH